MQTTQRRLAFMAGAASAALVLSSCGAGDGSDGNTEITVASLPNAFLAPLYVGVEEGYFDEEGLDVDIVELESGQAGVSAVVSGTAQFADIGLDDLAILTSEGEDSLFMLYNLVNRVTLTLVMDADLAAELGVDRDASIEERFAALEGLNLGVTAPGAATDKYMRYYLREAGLDPERDAEIVAIGGGGSLLAALESGQIDAYHLSPPTPYIAEAEGFGTILIDGAAGDVPLFSDFAYTGFAGNKEWAEENPEAAEGFVTAISRGMDNVAADPDAAAETILPYLGTDDLETNQQTLEALLPAMSETGCFGDGSVEESIGIMQEAELLTIDVDTEEGGLWSNEYNAGDC